MIASGDEEFAWRFFDLFSVTIRNPNTLESYYQEVERFLDWYERRDLSHVDAIMPILIAAYVYQLAPSQASVRSWPALTMSFAKVLDLRLGSGISSLAC